MRFIATKREFFGNTTLSIVTVKLSSGVDQNTNEVGSDTVYDAAASCYLWSSDHGRWQFIAGNVVSWYSLRTLLITFDLLPLILLGPLCTSWLLRLSSRMNVHRVMLRCWDGERDVVFRVRLVSHEISILLSNFCR